MLNRISAAMLILVLAVAAPMWAEEKESRLSLGDQAPPLALNFVKGTPVTLEEGKGSKVFVVEFWATWCGPCRESIPHLSELQQKYGHKGLVVVGITDESTSKVYPYLKEMGSKMDYRVAIDKYNLTASRYMEPFGLNGIPHAFVVDKSGRLVWHGHPMDPFMEQLVEALLKQEPKKPQAQSVSDGGSDSK